MSIKDDIKKRGIEPLFLSDPEGRKIGVVLKIEEFERIMGWLSEHGIDLAEMTSKAASGFVETNAEIVHAGGETARPLENGLVLFEMQDEFCSAQGILLPDGKRFKVLAGSKASGIVDRKLPPDVQNIREELMMLQVLVKDTRRGDMVFTRDYEFDDASIAASTIAASPRNGRLCWISIESGKPMGKMNLG